MEPAAPVAFAAIRHISMEASGKVAKVLAAELKHEEEEDEQANGIKNFLKDSKLEFLETRGDVNMALQREVGAG